MPHEYANWGNCPQGRSDMVCRLKDLFLLSVSASFKMCRAATMPQATDPHMTVSMTLLCLAVLSPLCCSRRSLLEVCMQHSCSFLHTTQNVKHTDWLPPHKLTCMHFYLGSVLISSEETSDIFRLDYRAGGLPVLNLCHYFLKEYSHRGYDQMVKFEWPFS